MDSSNFSKGYTKVHNPSQNHQQPSATTALKSTQRRRFIILAAASLTILLTIIIAVLAAAGGLIREPDTESPTESDQQQQEDHPSDPTESLKTVCSVTKYLDSCINSISSLNDPPKSDPVHFFNLSLQVSLRELTNLSSLPKALIAKCNDKRTESALNDCVNLFDGSLSQLNNSVELMKKVGGPGQKVLTEMKISDLQTWISAAMTDQETCLDGLDEMGSTVVDEVRVRVHKSNEYMSNSLAILNNLKNLLQKFGLPMP